MGRSRYDWPAITTDYVTGILKADGSRHWPSVLELSNIRGMPYHYLRAYATRQKWTEKRSNHLAKLEEERLTEARKQAVETLRAIDENAAVLARAGLALAGELMSRRKPGQTAGSTVTELRASDLATLASAVATLQRTAHLSLGAATEIVDTRHRPGAPAGSGADDYFDIMAELHGWKPDTSVDGGAGKAGDAPAGE